LATFLELAWKTWDQFTNRPSKVNKIHSLVTCCLPDEAINSEITDSLIFQSVMTTIPQVKLSCKVLWYWNHSLNAMYFSPWQIWNRLSHMAQTL